MEDMEDIKDIIYISDELILKIKEYCSDRLLSEVFESFEKNATVVVKKDGETPSKFWSLTRFIADDTIDIMNKLNVILSFIQSGGTIEYQDKKYFDIVNIVAILKQQGLINDDQLSKLMEPWFQFNMNGQIPWFDKFNG